MDDDGEDIYEFQPIMEFTQEDIFELNDIINVTAASNVEEISKWYKSFDSTNDYGGNIEKEMPKVDNVESNGLKPLLIENFSTREELIDRVRNVASMEGYVTTIRRSKADRYVVIGCDRGGKYRRASVPLDEWKRISASRLINCPFEIKGKKKVGECWKVEIKNASHNREPSSEMSGHPYCRRFSQEEVLSLRQMSLAGVPPRQIISSLQQSNPNCKAIARTLYNTKANIRKEALGGRTVIEALFEEFGQGDFSFDVERDGDGHLTHLFFAHPSSIALTKSYPDVFVMDCT